MASYTTSCDPCFETEIMHHSSLSVPVAEGMPAAVHAESRTLGTPSMAAPLVDNANHTLFAVLPAELRLLAGSFAIRW